MGRYKLITKQEVLSDIVENGPLSQKINRLAERFSRKVYGIRPNAEGTLRNLLTKFEGDAFSGLVSSTKIEIVYDFEQKFVLIVFIQRRTTITLIAEISLGEHEFVLMEGDGYRDIMTRMLEEVIYDWTNQKGIGVFRADKGAHRYWT